MSTELYIVCRKARRCVHIGTRYSIGTRLFTIGPRTRFVERWLDKHCDCDLSLENENEVDEPLNAFVEDEDEPHE